MALPKSYRTHRRVRARRASPQQQGRLLARRSDAGDACSTRAISSSTTRSTSTNRKTTDRRLRYRVRAAVFRTSARSSRLAFPARNITLRVPMQVQVARISPVVMELAVEVPADDGEGRGREGLRDAAEEGARTGFRPGKAPRQVLAHLYGPQVTSDVVNAIVNDTLPKALVREERSSRSTSRRSRRASSSRAPRSRTRRASRCSRRSRRSTTRASSSFARPRRRPKKAVERAARAPAPAARAARGARARAPRRRRATSSPSTSRSTSTAKELKDGGGEGVQLELGSGQVLPELDAGLVGREGRRRRSTSRRKLPDGAPAPRARGQDARRSTST